MNETHKRQIRNHSIIILIGILIIIVFGNETSWLRYFNILAILIILRSLIWFISNSEEILFYIFPTKTIREKKPKLKDKIWSHLSMVLFFSGLVFLIFQMGNIENIIEESSFWKNFGFLGFSFSLIGLFFLYKFQPSVFSESGRRYSVIFGFVFGLTGLTISTTSFLNKKNAEKQTVLTEFTINRKSTGGKKNRSHWIFIKIKESERRFEIKPNLWNKLKVGDRVLLELQKGHFEYDFVRKIKPTANTVYN
ncbi:hypothetical protein [Leeuwenhoekiella sp. MAR_2009_132]|uniref:hypothetical protein n=1 Tax=Leeuwenhoekiella sp. MAR_2009_132 TaxID=1392489 RepID=UPI00048FCEAA|nr:hypothetical protein [Leeuwenhoekiella sp. MAR_2009_132]